MVKRGCIIMYKSHRKNQSSDTQNDMVRIQSACEQINADVAKLKTALLAVFDMEPDSSVFSSITSIEKEVEHIAGLIRSVTGINTIGLACSRILSRLQTIKTELANTLDVDEYRHIRTGVYAIDASVQYIEICLIRMMKTPALATAPAYH